MKQPTFQFWPMRLLGRTGGRIAAILAGGQRTVAELGKALGLTPNAVRMQLTKLERDGLVEQAGQREGVRKPHLLYQLSPQADKLFPKAYAPVLNHLLTAIAQRHPEDVGPLIEEVGKRIASAQDIPDDPEKRVEYALAVMAELGAIVELQADKQGHTIIQGKRCPLSEVVGDHPELCRSLEVLISELLGKPVRECCDRSQPPACRFKVLAEGD